ncbi:DUF6266 family protein [Parapedobacter lycopersici]|uniref:DUF6266 family protein n=1 Tax=Parapedobacter lycopersici TaxID=1864939 RepID=UPI003340B686
MGGAERITGGAAHWREGGPELTWTDNSGEEQAKSKDYLLVLLFFPQTSYTEFTFNGAYRHNGRQFIRLSEDCNGQPVHIYASFTRYDGSDISPSSYLTVG